MERTRDILNQLLDVYYLEEPWQKNKMPVEEARKYHSNLLDSGNISYYEENEEVLGYVEYWKINYEQFGRIICGEPFSAYLEDVNSGNIAYVANTWIKEDERRGRVVRILKLMFYKNCCSCDYYVGEARRKRTGLIKVFKREDLQSRLFKRGVI